MVLIDSLSLPQLSFERFQQVHKHTCMNTSALAQALPTTNALAHLGVSALCRKVHYVIIPNVA